MKSIIAASFAAAFVAAVGLMNSSPSQAMALAPLSQVQDGTIIQIFGGWPAGGHRGPYDGCRPLYNCPRGWHTGPYGRRCVRN